MTGRRPKELKLISYEDFRPLVETGWFGLQHSEDALSVGGSVQYWTKSDYSHFFMLGWNLAHKNHDYDSLMLGESYTPDSRLTSLRFRVRNLTSVVDGQPTSCVDIYRLRPEMGSIDFDKAWWQMNHFCGQDYPESHITHDLLAIATGKVIDPIPNQDDKQEVPRTCSEAGYWAYKTSGMIPFSEWNYLVFPASGLPRFRGFADDRMAEYLWTPYKIGELE
jgi:hypothetical protein